MKWSWEAHTGTAPVGLGATPVLHEGHWLANNGESVLRFVGAVSATEQAAATAMNTALASHGYRESDQALYTAFQAAAGLTVDGFPGTQTMTALNAVLAQLGVAPANVPIYPWLATGGYDGVNAPTQAQWLGNSTGTLPTIVVPGTATTTSSSTTIMGMPAWLVWVLGGTAAAALLVVTYEFFSKPAGHAHHSGHSGHSGKKAVHHAPRHARELSEAPRRRRKKSKRSRKHRRRSRK